MEAELNRATEAYRADPRQETLQAVHAARRRLELPRITGVEVSWAGPPWGVDICFSDRTWLRSERTMEHFEDASHLATRVALCVRQDVKEMMEG